MTTNTNSYAAIKRAEKEPSEDPATGSAWKEVTPDELAAWIGIVVHMGVHSSPATRDYWKHDGLTATGEVVYHLLGKLPNSKYWIVYLDNFYTSLPLLGRLRHDSGWVVVELHGPARQDFPLNSKFQSRRLRSTSTTLSRHWCLKKTCFLKRWRPCLDRQCSSYGSEHCP